MSEFLDLKLGGSVKAGPIVTVDGEEIGRHRGLHRYTVGQRRGLGLPDQTPWYVCALDADENRLIVGKNDNLDTRLLTAVAPHWLVASPPESGARFKVKVRSTHSGAMATITELDQTHITIEFDQLQRAISPGQFAVLYDNDRVIGSAEIIAS